MSDVLRGIILRDERDTLVVQPASAEDIAKFAPRVGMAVSLSRASMSYAAAMTMLHSGDGYIRTAPGEILYNLHQEAVAVVDDVRAHVEQIDTTSYDDGMRRYSPGRVYVVIRAHGL